MKHFQGQGYLREFNSSFSPTSLPLSPVFLCAAPTARKMFLASMWGCCPQPTHGTQLHGLGVRKNGLLMASGALAAGVGEHGTPQGNDGDQAFCRRSVCGSVEERTGDRMEEDKVQTIPGREDNPVLKV